MATIQGKCHPVFGKVKDILERHIATEEELGASICVNINGQNVVDIWGGYTDSNRTQLWTEGTITAVWSITKCVTNLAALMLVDRGLLDPFEKVAKYWPEFAANGKENIEVRHILSHTAGLPAWDAPISIEELYDVPNATERLANQAPWWPPGTTSGYHLISQGHLVGELVKRTTGKHLEEFIYTEITEPIQADFHIGAKEKDWSRISDLIPAPSLPVPPDLEQDSIAIRAVRGSPIKAEYASSPEFRKTQLGASNGFGNARSVVRALSAISLGGDIDGKKLLSPETVNLIFKKQSEGVDLVLGMPITFGIGFALPNKDGPRSWIPEGRVCYWGGWGGSIAIMDMDRKMTICYAMNKMQGGTTGSPRTEAYVRAIYDAVNTQESGMG